MKIGELDVGQDLKFQKRSWRVERTGWIVGLLVVAAALLGLLGQGPLSKAKAAAADNRLVVEYNRFERYQSPVHLNIQFLPAGSTNHEVRLWLDRAFVEGIEMRHLDPEPETVEIDGERFVYVFQTGELPAAVKVFFHFEPNKFGKTPVRLGLVNGPTVEFSQFYFP